MDKDYITISCDLFRKIRGTPKIPEEKDALLDLIYMATQEEHKGKCSISIRTLADRWSWTVRKVRTFLGDIQRDDIASVSVSDGKTVISFLSKNIIFGTPNDTILAQSKTDNQIIGKKIDTISAHQTTQHDSNKKKTVTINTKAKELFMEHFQKVFGEAYYWEAKDAVNMDRLIKKLTNSRKKRELTIDDDSVLNALSVFLEKIKDEWVLQNFTVPIISSKYNSLVSQMKEAAKKGMDVGVSLTNNDPNKYRESKTW